MSRDERSAPEAPPLDVLLVPGLDGTGRLFAPFLAALPRTIAPSVIPYPPAAVTLEAIEEHVASRLPAGRPFAIVGESFGGLVTIRVAARRPPGLQAVALVASFLRRPGPRVPPFVLRAFLRPPLLRCASRPSLLRPAMFAGAAGGMVRQASEVLRSLDPRVLADRARIALGADVREAFRSLDCRLLHLRGSRDRLIAARCAAEMKALRPDLQEAVLDAPHLVLQARPAEAAGILADFLRV